MHEISVTPPWLVHYLWNQVQNCIWEYLTYDLVTNFEDTKILKWEKFEENFSASCKNYFMIKDTNILMKDSYTVCIFTGMNVVRRYWPSLQCCLLTMPSFTDQRYMWCSMCIDNAVQSYLVVVLLINLVTLQ